jgi:hypothetical protein
MDSPTILNAKYVACLITGDNDSISCQIGDRYCSVPIDSNNSDYAEIMRQVQAGTLTIADAD